MNQYWMALFRPAGYDPSTQLDASVRRGIDVLNREMLDAGVVIFVGGLQPTETTSSLVPQPNGDVICQSGTDLDAEHYVDGFWVLSCRDIQEAEEWGRKAALACRGSIQVRPFH